MKTSQLMVQDRMAYLKIRQLIGGNGVIAVEIPVRVFTIMTSIWVEIIMITI